MSLDFGLNDVHILITGAAGGIGLETVKTFQKLGARITAHYSEYYVRIVAFTWLTALDTSPGELAKLSNIVALQADVRNEVAVDRLFNEAAQHNNNGPVSVLIVNHGIWPSNNAHIADMELSQWVSPAVPWPLYITNTSQAQYLGCGPHRTVPTL